MENAQYSAAFNRRPSPGNCYFNFSRYFRCNTLRNSPKYLLIKMFCPTPSVSWYKCEFLYLSHIPAVPSSRYTDTNNALQCISIIITLKWKLHPCMSMSLPNTALMAFHSAFSKSITNFFTLTSIRTQAEGVLFAITRFWIPFYTRIYIGTPRSEGPP